MNAPSTRISLAAIAIAALFATPAVAAGVEESVVPPSNSAATQYTETFPTTGGDKKTDQKPSHRSPAKVLGSHNAQKLEKQGPEGKAAAKAAAATAPPSIATPPPTHSPSADGTGNGDQAGSSGEGTGGSSTAQPRSDTANKGNAAPTPVSEPAGSSGLGSAIGQATGLSSAGGSGPLLPFVILATLIWCIAYLWRQRRQTG